MKKERILKLIIVLITGVILFSMSVNVFATVDADTGLDFFEDTNDELDRNTTVEDDQPANEATENTTPANNTNTNTNTSTNTNNYNTNLPEAGAAENTMAGIAITVLGITAIYAYKKVNEYKNI